MIREIRNRPLMKRIGQLKASNIFGIALPLLNQVLLLRPSHTTKIFTKIFLKKSLSIYKTVEKIIAVVKKSCSVHGR